MIKTLNFSKYNLNLNDKNNVIVEKLKSLNYESLLIFNNTLFDENNNYDIIYNFIRQIYAFHHNKLKLESNINYYVTFSLENDETFHLNYFIDKITQERIYPLLTSLTYLDNSLKPVVLTDICFDDYKYKNFKNFMDLLFSFPCSLDHISFDGKYYYGVPQIFKNKCNSQSILKINIWNKQPPINNYLKNIEKNLDNCKEKNKMDIIFTESLYHRQLFLDDKLINKDFVEEIFYAKNNNVFLEFEKIFYNLNDYYSIEENIKIDNKLTFKIPIEVDLLDANHTFTLITQKFPIIQNKMFKHLKNKYGNIIYDLYHIYYKNELTNLNRFFKCKNINKYFTNDMCKWYINNINQYNKYTNNELSQIICADKIKDIFNFCLICIESITEHICEIYDLDDIKINVNTINICYINNSLNNNFEYKSKDNTFFIGIIPLSNISIIYDKTNVLKKGDLLLLNNLRLDEINININNSYYLIYEIELILNI